MDEKADKLHKAYNSCTKYVEAIELLYHDTTIRYSYDDNFFYVSCLMVDEFIIKDKENTHKETIGSVIKYNFSDTTIEILHNVKLHDWIDNYMKLASILSTEDLNLFYIEDL